MVSTDFEFVGRESDECMETENGRFPLMDLFREKIRFPQPGLSKLRIPAPPPEDIHDATSVYHTCPPYIPEMALQSNPTVSGLVKVRAWDWRTCDRCLADEQDRKYVVLRDHLRREEQLCFVVMNDESEIKKLRKRITEHGFNSICFKLRSGHSVVLTNAPRARIRRLKKAKQLHRDRVESWLHAVVYRGTDWTLPKPDRPVLPSNRWKTGTRDRSQRKYQLTGSSVTDEAIKAAVDGFPDMWCDHLQSVAEITGVPIGHVVPMKFGYGYIDIPFLDTVGLSDDVRELVAKAQGIRVSLEGLEMEDSRPEEIFALLRNFAEAARSLIDAESADSRSHWTRSLEGVKDGAQTISA